MSKSSLKFAMLNAKANASSVYYKELVSLKKVQDTNSETFWEDLKKQDKPKTRIKKGDFVILKNYSELEIAKLMAAIDNTSAKSYNQLVENTISHGDIVSIDEKEVIVTFGKMDIIVDVKRDKLDTDGLAIGDTIPLYIEKSKGGLSASYSKGVKETEYQNLLSAIGTEKTFVAKVVELIHGGYWLDVAGNRCFMPGSLANLVRLDDFSSIVGQKLNVLIVGFEKGKIIASHRDWQKIQNVEESQKIEIGKLVTGVVSGITNKGVFVELEKGVYGLMPPYSTVDENLQKGDSVDVYVRNFDEKNRIVLTQRFEDLNQWEFIDNFLQTGNLIDVVVKAENRYYYFVHICTNVRGRIKKSTIPKDVVIQENQHLTVVVTKIDAENKVVSCQLYNNK